MMCFVYPGCLLLNLEDVMVVVMLVKGVIQCICTEVHADYLPLPHGVVCWWSDTYCAYMNNASPKDWRLIVNFCRSAPILFATTTWCCFVSGVTLIALAQAKLLQKCCACMNDDIPK
eukprot:15166838-Ditylum_brightwellii.AAC.1